MSTDQQSTGSNREGHASGWPAAPLRVRELMRDVLVAVHAGDDVVDVAKSLRRQGAHHAPVLDHADRVIGVVCRDDLVARDPDESPAMGRVTVREVMRRATVTVDPDDRAREAAELMLTHDCRCLPVVEDGELVGILTEADFVRLLAPAP